MLLTEQLELCFNNALVITGSQYCISQTKKLKLSKTKYSTFNGELLTVYLSTKYFRHFDEGRVFYILTDHKPLTYFLLLHSDHYTPRQICH